MTACQVQSHSLLFTTNEATRPPNPALQDQRLPLLRIDASTRTTTCRKGIQHLPSPYYWAGTWLQGAPDRHPVERP